jgi:hypothetical protein
MGAMTREDRHDRERWIASGLPDAVVTIMFRDATLPPPHAARWYDSSLTTDEIVEYRRAGRPAPDVAFESALAARGLPTDRSFVESWEGFSADQILGAIDRGFTSGDEFAPWAQTDVDVSEVRRLDVLGSVEFDRAKAVSQLRAGATPEEIAFSLESGLKVKKVRAWMRRGLSAATAREWSQAGFSAKETARWAEVVADPDVATSLVAVGFDPDSAGEQRPDGGWNVQSLRRHAAIVAGADEASADAWAATSLPDRKLAAWVASGVDPADAGEWRELDIGPADASVWSAHGFSPADADAWRRAGVDPEIATRRRDAGARPPVT